jgi:hypothetical protein
MKSFIVTSSMGKRLIGLGMARHPAVQGVLRKGTLVIVSGTTNGYVAEEVFKLIGGGEGFSRKGFRRGFTIPPGFDAKSVKADFTGDVVLVDGAWQKGKEIFDVVDEMKAGDLIVKGANALDLRHGQAGVLIGHPMGGTAGAAIPAVIGRRVRMIIPVGLEKRVAERIDNLAAEMNSPGAEGPRLMPLPGEVFTELDAIALLTGATARLVAAGGIYGAEGAVWIAVSGDARQIEAAEKLIQSVAGESPCQA